jgi:hypothetical protein
MTYRTAADVVEQMFPVDAGKDAETLRRRTLKIGAALFGMMPWPGRKRCHPRSW